MRVMRIMACALLASACTNEVSEPIDPEFEGTFPNDEPGAEVVMRCDSSQLFAPTPVKRLSNEQYRNALGYLFSDPEFTPVLDDAMLRHASRLPPDRDTGQTFASQDQRVTEEHISIQFDLSDTIASGVASTEARRRALAGECAENGVELACVEGFIRSFGRKAFRRPLTDLEVARLLELRVEGAEPAALFGDLVFSMIMAPQFLYVIETAGELADGSDQVLELTDWEVASRLAFTFWQAPPDDALLDAVEAGAFETEEGYRAEVRRVIDDPRSETFVRRFFDQWFKIPEAVEFPEDDPIFQALDDGFGADSQLYQDMRAEAHALIDQVMWDETRRYRDLLTTPEVFTTSDRLASLYEVEAWDGSGPAPRAEQSPRPGLLTRSAVLLSTGVTNPILRGAFLRVEVLCDDLTVPPDLPSEAFQFPEQQPNQSRRDIVDIQTSPQACVSCHDLINPLGYVMELYDGLGRYRTEEDVLDEEGRVISSVAIDPTVTPQLSFGDESSLSSPEELFNQIADHPKANACFARHLFRYAFRQDEDIIRDGCTMTAVKEAIDNGSIIDGLVALASQPAFKQRVIEEP